MNQILWTRTTKPANQDAAAASSRCLTVVDGATPLEGGEALAKATSRFARILADSVATHVQEPNTIRADLSAAVSHAQSRAGRHGVHATLSVAVWDQDYIATATIADSPVFVSFHEGHVHRIEDPAFAGREEAMLEQIGQRISSGEDPTEVYRERMEKQRANRHLRNRAGGTWVVSDDVSPQELVQHVHYQRIEKDGVSGIALMTDGLAAIAEKFRLIPIEQLVRVSSASQLDALWAQAIQVQRRDPAKAKYPRFSDQDDATLAAVVF